MAKIPIMVDELVYLASSKEHNIYAKIWRPTNMQNVKAVLQIAHGVAEHADRYDSFARFMVLQGFIVCANDHPGHGGSVKSKDTLGYFAKENGYKHAVRDMYSLTKLIKSEHPDLAYFLLGHSMGSLLARLYVSRYGSELSGAIFMGTSGKNPLLNLAIYLTKRGINKYGLMTRGIDIDKLLFGKFNKGIANVRTAFDWLSRDEALVDKYIDDELCGFPLTYGGYLDLFRLLDYVSRAACIKAVPSSMPVLFISGKRDPVGNYGKGVHETANRFITAGVNDVNVKLYDEARHELLNEINRDEVYAYLNKWINARLI